MVDQSVTPVEAGSLNAALINNQGEKELRTVNTQSIRREQQNVQERIKQKKQMIVNYSTSLKPHELAI